MTILTLVRHGQASFGGANYDQLSPLGRRQSRLLGEHWQRLGVKPDAVYTGAMQRQRDTATEALAVVGGGAVEQNPAFNEYDFLAVLRGYTPVVARRHPELQVDARKLFADPRQFQAVFERCIECWVADHPAEGPPFETWSAFRGRALEGLRAIATPDRVHVVVVTSGGVIAAALREALALGDDVAFQLNWRIYNASVHSFKMGKRGLSLTGYNNVAHLELAGDPALLTYR